MDAASRQSFAALQAKKPPLVLSTKTVKVAATSKPKPRPSASSQDSASRITTKSVSSKSLSHSDNARQNSTPLATRAPSKDSSPVSRIRKERSLRAKRSSPVITTPIFTSSDDESQDDAEKPAKRPRLDRSQSVDRKRTIRDAQAFAQVEPTPLRLIHARDIANTNLKEHDRDKYEAYFTVLAGEEEEAPTIKLQYPGTSRRERYQIVKPMDQSDFKPLEEIWENMQIAANFYLDEDTAEIVSDATTHTGLREKMMKYAKDPQKSRPGSQTNLIECIKRYNDLLSQKRQDGTIAKKLDAMTTVNLKLVEHIVNNQTYSRIVSPQVHLVRQYESFSDNVYGELLPLFLSRIFKETHLKSDQVFVDLGSGVGNCVLQAALEIGCESWGCEMMDNPSTLAKQQAVEFAARCRLWGLKPGAVHLQHDDFLKNEPINEALERADVVLINNQAFQPDLNDKLKMKFLDLKEGCQIVSLKPFRDPAHKVKDTNINDAINILSVKEYLRFSKMVSWTDDQGKWYIHKVDRTELNKFRSTSR